MTATPDTATTAARTYEVKTYGCQMNVHDSERLTGLLETAGYVAAPSGEQADIVVFNTCAVRENADNKLYGNLSQLKPIKAAHPGMQIAVGGCLAQKDRTTITTKAPHVDVVFGTHNIGSLPALLERARTALRTRSAASAGSSSARRCRWPICRACAPRPTACARRCSTGWRTCGTNFPRSAAWICSPAPVRSGWSWPRAARLA